MISIVCESSWENEAAMDHGRMSNIIQSEILTAKFRRNLRGGLLQ